MPPSEDDSPQGPDHTYGLEELADARAYRRYLYELIAPWCDGTLLEVGAGTGDFAALFPPDKQLIVTDSHPDYVQALHRRFEDREAVRVAHFDLLDPDLDVTADSAIAINVLEHIEDDTTAIRTISERVRPGGTVVVFVPGYPALFGEFDRMVGHVRRYRPRALRQAVTEGGLDVIAIRPVNLIGGVAWWFAVRLGKRTRPRAGLVRLYDRILVPIVRLLERRWSPPFGQSILCVARKPARPAAR